MSTADLTAKHCIVLGFILLTVILGLIFSRNVKNLRDYAIANKSYGAIILFMLALSTGISGNVLFFVVDSAYFGGLYHPFLVGIEALSAVLIGLFFSNALLCFPNALTLGDIVQTMYGRTAGILVGVMGFFFAIFRAGAQLACLGKIASLIGVSPQHAILAGGGIALLCTCLGGVRTIATTNVLHLAAIAFFFVILWFKISDITTSYNSNAFLLSELPAEKLQIFNHPEFSWFSLILCASPFLVFPTPMQHILTSGSARQLRKSMYYFSFFWILGIGALTIIGLRASLLYPNLKQGEQGAVLLHIIQQLCTSQVSQGLVATGLLAAVISTTDSHINAGSLLVIRNFLQPCLARFGYAMHELKWIRLVSFFIGAIAVLGAATKTDIRFLLTLSNIAVSLTAAPILLGLLGFKTSNSMFFMSVLASSIVEIVTKGLSYPTHFMMWAVGAVAFFLVHLLENKRFVRRTPGETNNNENGIKDPEHSTLWKQIVGLLPTGEKFKRFIYRQIHRYGTFEEEIGICLLTHFLAPNTVLSLVSITDSQLASAVAISFCSICLLLILLLKDLWPKGLQTRLFPLYYFFTIWFCLPFATSLILLLGTPYTKWPADIIVAIVFLTALVGNGWWTIGFAASGFGAAALVVGAVKGIPFPVELPPVDMVYSLVYALIAILAALWFFFKTRESKTEELVQFSTVITRAIIHDSNNDLNEIQAGAFQVRALLETECLYKTLEEKRKESRKKENLDSHGDCSSYLCFTTSFPNMVKEEVKHIIKSAHNVSRTAKTMGRLLKILQGVLEEPMELYSVQSQIAAAITQHPFDQEESACIHVDTSHDFTAKLPREGFSHVIINLIRNAFHHGKATEIKIWCQDHQLHIWDNGKGIPSSVLPHIFAAFYTTGNINNSGIGLTLVKKIISFCQGEIQCVSQEGQESYTEFIITLPPLSALDAQEAEKRQKLEAIEQKGRIAAAKEIAQRLLKLNKSIKEVAKTTGLSETEVANLKLLSQLKD